MQQTVSITELYEILSQKLGKNEAKTLANFVEAKVDKSVEDKSSHLAAKEDVLNLKVDMEKGFRSQSQWFLGVFMTLVVLILGLYATIIFNH